MGSNKARRERRTGLKRKTEALPTIAEIRAHNQRILGKMAQDCIQNGSIRCYSCGSPSGVPGITLHKKVIEDRIVMMCSGCDKTQ